MRLRVTLLLVLAALAVAACADVAGQASLLQRTRWILQVYRAGDGSAALAALAPRATATFEDGTLTGSGGCNPYTTTYTLERDALTIAPIAATMMACPDPIGTQEQDYFAALGQVASFAVEGETLTLSGADGRPLLVFAAARPLPLVGTPWGATSVVDEAGTILAVSPDTPISAYFAEDGRVSGFTACNRYTGPFREQRTGIRIGPVVTTRTECATPGDAELEAAYLAALEGATSYEISGAVLDLRNRDGDLLASLRILLPELGPEPSPLPSPSPTGSPAPTPTAAPTATPAPTTKPTARPSATPAPTPTPRPTSAPTGAPTAAPTPDPTPSPTPVALSTCALPTAGVVVSYPATWFTVQDIPELACLLYGPEPVTVDPETRATNATVSVIPTTTLVYADVVAALTNPASWTGIATQQVTVSDLPATRIVGTATGAGSVPAGITQYSYVVDRGGPNGVVLVQTAAREQDESATTNRQVVDLIASTIQIEVVAR